MLAHCAIIACLFLLWAEPSCSLLLPTRTSRVASSRCTLQASKNDNSVDNDSLSPPVTITVCTGPDCRVDGSTQTLKQLQSCVSQLNQGQNQKQKSITIQSKNCLGPCGEGPCVQVLNAQKQRVFRGEQPNREPSDSWMPADSFGADTKRIYQVRNAAQAAFVLELAASEAHLPKRLIPDESSFPPVQSTRAWYDRNNNDRKVLQRLLQVAVAAGLLEYSKTHDELGPLPWGIAASIVLTSNFIMKDNLLEQVVVRRR